MSGPFSAQIQAALGGMATWNRVPFNAANFQGFEDMTWTLTSGDVLTQDYAVVGSTMFYAIYVRQTTTGGEASHELLIALPAGYKIGGSGIYRQSGLRWSDGTTTEIGNVTVVTNETNIRLTRLDFSDWPLVTNLLEAQAIVTIPIARV